MNSGEWILLLSGFFVGFFVGIWIKCVEEWIALYIDDRKDTKRAVRELRRVFNQCEHDIDAKEREECVK